jgi:hypothetical protein
MEVHDMDNECDYTCSLRIDGDSVDGTAMDRRTGAMGEHSTVRKRKPQPGEGETFARWELEAFDPQYGDQWPSLTEALGNVADRILASRPSATQGLVDVDAYWWCGCFHHADESTIRLPAHCLDKLARIGARIILNNYFPAQGEEDGGVETSISSEVYPHNHEYVFALVAMDGAQQLVTSEGDGDSIVWSDFGAGLTACLDRLADEGATSGASILCDHTQHAFDGGPRIDVHHLSALTSVSADLSIIWQGTSLSGGQRA